MKSIILLLCTVFLNTVTSTVPTIAISCVGEHQYINEDGHCTTCEKCPAGMQILGACGYGKRSYDYKCVECPMGHYTATAGYNVCVVCAPCQAWNRVYDEDCTPMQNSICGSCISGYYQRNLRGEGHPDEECLLCTEWTKDEPECMKPDDSSWSNFTIAGWSLAVFLAFIIVIGIGCLCHRKRRKSARKRHQHNVFFDVTPTSSPINVSSQSLGDSRSELSVVEMEPVKPSYPPVTSQIDEVALPAKIEATIPFLPPVRPACSHHMPSEHYSNMPTAQFDANPLSHHNGLTPSNLPTNLYDDMHPSQMNNVALHHNNMILTPSPNVCPTRHHQNEFSCHENVPRVGKLAGHHQTHEPFFEPESFDTRSDVGETTQPHKI